MSTRMLAWTIWGITVALALTALALLAASFDAPVPDSWGFRGFTTTFAIGFGTLGALILATRRNLVGWLLLIAGLFSALQAISSEYAIYGVLARPGSLPHPELFAWFESWIWVFVVVMIAVVLPLWFPNGHFPSPRWRVIGVLALLAALALASGLALNEGPMNNAPFVINPFGIPGLHVIDTERGSQRIENSLLFFLLYATLFACALAAAVSVIGRFRRARGSERQQIKWFALGAVATAITMIFAGTLQQYKAAQVLFILVIELVPASVAVAILRYRLYDIDVVINRALVYGATTALLGATFTLAVLVLQAPLRPLTGGNELAVAGSTMLTLAAFQPLRRRVQEAVDRRFYRSRYDAARTLDSFASRLRDDVDLDHLRSDLLSVIGDTVRPAHAGVWLRRSG